MLAFARVELVHESPRVDRNKRQPVQAGLVSMGVHSWITPVVGASRLLLNIAFGCMRALPCGCDLTRPGEHTPPLLRCQAKVRVHLFQPQPRSPATAPIAPFVRFVPRSLPPSTPASSSGISASPPLALSPARNHTTLTPPLSEILEGDLLGEVRSD